MWRDDQLAEICRDNEAGFGFWGEPAWLLIKRRLAVVAAAPSLGALIDIDDWAAPAHSARHAEVQVDIGSVGTLVLAPVTESGALVADTEHLVSEVTRVMVLEVAVDGEHE
ncbi:MAG: hypothetical protein AAGA59_18870 [Actinomycetota bacterium]